jgi:hypothetical protein
MQLAPAGIMTGMTPEIATTSREARPVLAKSAPYCKNGAREGNPLPIAETAVIAMTSRSLPSRDITEIMTKIVSDSPAVHHVAPRAKNSRDELFPQRACCALIVSA